MPTEARISLQELIDEFDLSKFGRAPANYDQEDLERLNHKIINIIPFSEIKNNLIKLGLNQIDENFWDSVKGNINKAEDVKDWWKICKENLTPIIEDKDLLQAAISCFPAGDIDDTTWGVWTKLITDKTGKKGKALFMPLRKALTAMEHGPELKLMLPLIGRDKILKRLSGESA
jgi:glutamyl-tRNA synthetase